MPPKKDSKQLVDWPANSPADLSKRAATPTVVTSMAVHLPPAMTYERPGRPANSQPTVSYESPLKKLKKALSEHTRTVIDRIDDLREFIKGNDVSLPEVRGSIRIQARVLWSVSETIKDMHFLRMYLGEKQAPEPLQQQQQEFKTAQQEDPFETNQYLITVSLYEVAPDDPNLPAPGEIITFTPTKLSLYRNCIQVNAKLAGIAAGVP